MDRTTDRNTRPANKPGARTASSRNAGGSRAGAVRINASAPPHKSAFRLDRTAKLSTALTVVIGGILWTTFATEAETGTSAPEVARASMPAPTFFFDDAVDALTARFSPNTLQAQAAEAGLLAGATPTRDRSSVGNNLDAGNSAMGKVDDSSFNALNPLVDDGSSSRTVTVTPLVDHPSLAAIRDKDNVPDDALTTVVAVAPGNTLSGILNNHGVKIDQMPKLLTDSTIKQYLSNLSIGQQLEINRLPNGDFHSLSTRVGQNKRITISQNSGDFAVASIDLPVEKERVVTSGTIEQSLYLAAEEADLKQSTIMELADIFQWELDFAKDIRKGDQFSLVYDRLYRDGSYIGDGDILAAEFIRGGQTHRAIRFTTDDGVTGYYSPDGQSKRRTFMRHPVDVVRITSKFNPNRLHPVLHQIRAHRGVDYGSPYGSPIYATADGKVEFSGVNGAYGNTVKLKHGKKFSTLYAHMSRIADKSIVGKRVKQGDVIGYVGKTGRVTGTHLHYEFRVNDKQIDPLKVELPAAQPIDAKYLPELKAISEEMSAQMRSVLTEINEQQVASVTGIVSERALPSQPVGQ